MLSLKSRKERRKKIKGKEGERRKGKEKKEGKELKGKEKRREIKYIVPGTKKMPMALIHVFLHISGYFL